MSILLDVSFNDDIYITGSTSNLIIGEIIIWPNSTNIPDGFLGCNGQSLSTTNPDYTALFSIIGYRFTSAGSGSTFDLPALNVSSEDDNILIQGDSSMTNVSNTLTNTLYANIHNGNNLIEFNDIPIHSHNVSVSSSLTLDSLSFDFNFNNITTKRANETDINSDTNNVTNGAAGTIANHTHNITYSGNSNRTHNGLTVNIAVDADNTELEIDGNTFNSQSNFKPSSIKCHYIICYSI